MRKFLGILLLSIDLLLLIAGVWLVVGNSGNDDWRMHIYTTAFDGLNRAVVLLATAAIAIVLLIIWRFSIPAALRELRIARAQKRERLAHDRVEELKGRRPKEEPPPRQEPPPSRG